MRARDVESRLRSREIRQRERLAFVLEQPIEIETPVPAGEGRLTLDAVLVDAETLKRVRADHELAMVDIGVLTGQMLEQDAELQRAVAALESIRITLHRPGWTAKQKLDEAIEKSDAWALSQ